MSMVVLTPRVDSPEMLARAEVPAALLFLLTLPIFSCMVPFGDHGAHVEVALAIRQGKSIPPHPLFHLGLLALIGGKGTLAAPGVAAALLALAVAVRAWLTAVTLARGSSFSTATLTVLCVALGLAIPLPNWWGWDWIRGQPSATIWHNPTCILAAPFALATFFLGVELLDRPGPRLAACTGGVMALGVLAKPNYVLAFGPVFGPMLVETLRRGWRRNEMPFLECWGLLVLALGPPLGVLAGQALWFVSGNPILFGQPLRIWHSFSPDVPASVFLGTAFPLTVAGCYPRQVNADNALKLAWTTVGIAIATFALLSDSAPGHGNWGWGMNIATTVLFVASTVFVLRQVADWRRWLCFAVLGGHALSGAWYLARCAT